ncbi:hypothetical protein LCGC14_1270300 [marine sediment metagenome]|uniref:Uncharacterized protein n=1 Tax=marine sediment metagenome TaxID=412755 RepID=A0A0F9KYB9_9ZZZZ
MIAEGTAQPCIHGKYERITWTAAWRGDIPMMICSKGNAHGLLSPQLGIFEAVDAFYKLGKSEATPD